MPLRKWILPLVLVSALVFVLSLRQLSDPDLGFHLKYGKWIVTNQCVPVNDLSTYTVPTHAYIDLHWLFQVVLYGVYILTGYPGISIFVCVLSMFLALLMLLRLRSPEISPPVTCIALFAFFLIIEPRIAPRPEMFTFLFLAAMLLILDLYAAQRKNMLYLLPVIMLLWCNMHALFVIGLVVMAVYFISLVIRYRKFDNQLLTWMIISWLVCLINPYGIRGFALPIELLTRFDPNNIYNQHIQEFIPFFSQPHFVIRDYLFIILLGISAVFTFLTFDKRKPHIVILLLLFGFLAIGSVRNIPLFALIAVPIISRQLSQLSGKTGQWCNHINQPLFVLMIIFPALLIPRLFTNAYYTGNNSFNKTGIGIDNAHLPAQAATFLLNNHLDERIINSIGFGGWFSWTLPQPVFMDGRLEVMQEPLYREVTQSWNDGLENLISRYHPQLIVYNYLKYYPWTLQIKEMGNWRLIYADGIAAIFASNTCAEEIPAVDLSSLPSSDIPGMHQTFRDWVRGFYQQTDDEQISRQHLDLFRLQMVSERKNDRRGLRAVTFFNAANLKYNSGDINGALADYDSAIMLQPDYAKAFNNRGILLASAFRNYTGAISDFTRAIEINSAYGDAYLGRGTAFFMMKDPASACKDWKIAWSYGNSQAATLVKLHCTRQ